MLNWLFGNGIGTNLGASLIWTAITVVIGLLLWPPTRRWITQQLRRLHEHNRWTYDALHAIHHGEALPPHPHFDPLPKEPKRMSTAARPSGLRGLHTPRQVELPFLHELATNQVRAELVPQSDDTSNGFTGWGMLGNGPDPTLTINGGQPVGDCFFAAVAHGLMNKALVQVNGVWVINPDLAGEIQPTSDHWVGLYLGYQNQQSPGTTATSGPDEGTEPTSGFQWLQAGGVIKRWGLVHLDQLNEATYDNKGVLLACALDVDAEREFENHQVWRNLSPAIDPDEGGHAIFRVGWTPRFGVEITWAHDQEAARPWEAHHIQQAYWFQAPWEPDPVGYDFGPLDRAVAAI